MQQNSKVWRVLLLPSLIILAMMLAACAGDAAPAPAPPAEDTAADTAAEAEPTEAPEEEPMESDESTEEDSMASEDAMAGDAPSNIVNEIVFVEEPLADVAVTRLETGDLDIYADSTSDPEVFGSIEDAGLQTAQSFGLYNELTFNPAGPVFEGSGKLNPFALPTVREAMNWLVDRDFVAQELYGGLAQPRYMAITPAFPDYAKLVDVARQIELQYAYNPEKAAEIIGAEMEGLGAEMVDGKWNFEGEPVEVKVLIRIEDVRRDIGDYVSNQLEDIGFTVTRDYKSAADASPIWISGEPSAGEFHIYTGAWITTQISRDQAGNFDFFYTDRGLSSPLWQAYTPSEEFDEISDRLARRDFTTIEERKELFAQVLPLSLQDSTRVWIASQIGATPYRTDVAVGADLAGGISGATLWPHTIRTAEGDSVTIGLPSMLTEPWNPVDGSNWIYDLMIQRGMGGSATVPDPFTGLARPQRIERAEVVVEEGLPVGKTLDWVDLEFAAEIAVPEDALIDWDAETQAWITVGEAHPDGLTALRKSTVYYPSELWDVPWHDGSTLSAADLMLSQIIGFERAKEASAIFDESTVPSFEQFQTTFKGWKIVSVDPLVVEHYSDVFGLDAEANVNTYYPGTSWTMLSLGIMAEADGELAFSSNKAEANEVEHMSYIAGPSLEIFEAKMDAAAEGGMIPYADAMADYVTADEISERWAAMQAFYADNGHFWVDEGQYMLKEVFPVEGSVVLQRFDGYPDDADKWMGFAAPQIAEVALDGDSRVTIGDEVTFDINVSFDGAPYATSDIDTVKYLVFDALGDLVISGEATAVEDGLFQVMLSSDETGALETGANLLEVAVVPNLVSVPTFDSIEFVTVP